MRLKLLIFVLLISVIAVFAVVRTNSKIWQSVRLPEKDRLHWYANKAKAEGKRKIFFPGPNIDYAGVDTDLDEALNDYSVVVATAVDSKGYIEDSNYIRTWTKFRILEPLTRKNSRYCYTCPPISNPPEDMAVTDPEYFLLETSGGTVIVDGVEVTMTNREIPPFEIGKPYLLLISFETSGVAGLGTGPSSVFSITDDGSMNTVGNWKLQTQIAQRFNLKLSALKSHLKK